MRPLLGAVVCVAACGGKVAIDHATPVDASVPDVETTPDGDAGAPDVAISDATSATDAGDGALSSIIAYPTDQPFKMAQDENFLYWTQGYAPGEVAKVAKDGGTPVLLATNQHGPFGIAVDATSVYFVDQGLTTNTGVIMKMDLDGGSQTALATAQAEPVSLAIDSSHVYWTNSGWMNASTIMRADLDGANTTLIGTGTGLSWIVVGAGYVWWAGIGADGNGATVTRAELDGSNPTVMLTTTGGYDGIGVDSVNLYAADREKLQSMPIGGGAVTTLATYSPEESSASIVPDGENVYWSVAWDLEVTALGGATTVAASGPPPMSVVVDQSYIYWLSDNPQTLSRLPKP